MHSLNDVDVKYYAKITDIRCFVMLDRIRIYACENIYFIVLYLPVACYMY